VVTYDLHFGGGLKKDPENSQDHVYNPSFKAHNYYAPQLCVAAASRADEAVSLARTICAMEDRSTVFPQTEDPRLRGNWCNHSE
jgi:hypothetical protein